MGLKRLPESCPPPDRILRSPRLVLPAGAIDSHAHVLGPAATYPYAVERVYTPEDCTLADYVAQLKALGVSRGVLVQPSVYGTDNRAMLAALSAQPIPLRGVAVIRPDISDIDLREMHALGVRGIRCNLVDLKDRLSGIPLAQLTALANRVRPLGWHLELLAHVHETPTLFNDFINFPVDVVFGHFGYVPMSTGIDNPGFEGLLALMAAGKAWVKMTGPYRISALHSPPYADLRSTVAAVIDANPDRLVWGSDWPHVMMKRQMPNDADLVDLLADWIPNGSLLQKILIDNPQKLYDFL